MKRLIVNKLSLGVAVVIALRSTAAEATGPSQSSPPAPGGSGIDPFRIIFERNIFNPNRSSRSSESEPTQREPERRVQTESFALVGTMIHENGRFAFFDSSSADYRKVLKVSEEIAGYTIASVTPEDVTLQSTNDGDVKLPVGMQLQRQDEGKWTVGARPEEASSSAGGSTRFSSSSTASPASGTGGEADEILRRMMQRREQEAGAGGSPPPLAPPSPVPPPARSNSSPSSAAEDEIVRRMLEKREQELKK